MGVVCRVARVAGGTVPCSVFWRRLCLSDLLCNSKITQNFSTNFQLRQKQQRVQYPRYVVEVTISEFIPEWIPMFGKKIRLYHLGMKKQCNNCYGLGHLRADCQSKKLGWLEYINTMKKFGKFETQMFGSWNDIEARKEEME
jgi:hypothetical protein